MQLAGGQDAHPDFKPNDISTKCKYFHIRTWQIANDKWPFKPFFTNYVIIFHKTEVQVVVLRAYQF